MLCPEICPREQGSADPEVSPGPIAGDEEICRGAYDPMHFKREKLKSSFIRANDLLEGKLSVWRVATPPRESAGLDDIVKILEGFAPTDNKLYQVKACTAESVRKLSIATRSGRVFSVIDDCVAYPDGGKHPAHAVIAICEKLEPEKMTKDSELFEEIRNKIHLAFSANTKWAVAA